MLSIQGTQFRDDHGRTVVLRGINLSGNSKTPSYPSGGTYCRHLFFEAADDVSFVGKPFPVEDADGHIRRIRAYGYNIIRFIVVWEAIEHAGPGVYDEQYIDFVIKIIQICCRYSIWVYIDPHQDAWSRFSGGSGAPLWTLICAGLDPRNFADTCAAVVHNTYPDPANFPSMIWATNYERFACSTMFTLFFAGRLFAPKALIDGKNIQDYLQEHFNAAFAHLANRLSDALGSDDRTIIGWESINEVSLGYIGFDDLRKLTSEFKFRKGAIPTPFQSMMLASGFKCTVSTYNFGKLGPYKEGEVLIDPKGVSAWLPKDYDDSRYGWSRSSDWEVGQCIWALHEVWDPESLCLLKADYFGKDGIQEKIDLDYFQQNFLLPQIRQYIQAIRKTKPETILLLQPPTLALPPKLSSEQKEELTPLVYAFHYYDGQTLLNRTWNTLYNFDALGILRGKYSYPYLRALRFGKKAIRNCLNDQLLQLKNEGFERIGACPTIITEIGIPYDMDSKAAYYSGNYQSQYHAMDTLHFAMENGFHNYSIWNYCSQNDHDHGDYWNGEDLSVWSTSDIDKECTLYECTKIDFGDVLQDVNFDTYQYFPSIFNGSRAMEAFTRPSPVLIAGDLQSYEYNLSSGTFKVSVIPDSTQVNDSENGPASMFYVPHFILSTNPLIQVTSGKVEKHLQHQVVIWIHGQFNFKQEFSLVTNYRPEWLRDENNSIFSRVCNCTIS